MAVANRKVCRNVKRWRDARMALAGADWNRNVMPRKVSPLEGPLKPDSEVALLVRHQQSAARR